METDHQHGKNQYLNVDEITTDVFLHQQQLKGVNLYNYLQ